MPAKLRAMPGYVILAPFGDDTFDLGENIPPTSEDAPHHEGPDGPQIVGGAEAVAMFFGGQRAAKQERHKMSKGIVIACNTGGQDAYEIPEGATVFYMGEHASALEENHVVNLRGVIAWESEEES